MRQGTWDILRGAPPVRRRATRHRARRRLQQPQRREARHHAQPAHRARQGAAARAGGGLRRGHRELRRRRARAAGLRLRAAAGDQARHHLRVELRVRPRGPVRAVQDLGTDRAGGRAASRSPRGCPTSRRPAGATPTWTTWAPTSWPSPSSPALIHRNRTGEGQWIDMACTEAGHHARRPGRARLHGERPPLRRPGSRTRTAATAARWRRTASTRPTATTTGSRSRAATTPTGGAFAAVIGEPWAPTPRFADARRPPRASQDDLDAGWPLDRRAATGSRRPSAAGRWVSRLPRSPGPRTASTTTRTPRLGAVADRAHTAMGDVRVDGLPVHLSRDRLVDRAGRARASASTTTTCFGELLGLDDAEIDAAARRGR